MASCPERGLAQDRSSNRAQKPLGRGGRIRLVRLWRPVLAELPSGLDACWACSGNREGVVAGKTRAGLARMDRIPHGVGVELVVAHDWSRAHPREHPVSIYGPVGAHPAASDCGPME